MAKPFSTTNSLLVLIVLLALHSAVCELRAVDPESPKPSVNTAPSTRLTSQPGCKVVISGGNNIHDWQIDGNQVNGFVEMSPGNAPTRIEGTVPVRSLKGHEGLDKLMFEKLKADTFKEIYFSFDQITVKERGKDMPHLFDALGELVIAGVTNRVTVPISLLSMRDRKFKLSGVIQAKMTEYGITPPQIELTGGMIKVRDDVKVAVEWIVGKIPSPVR